MPTLRNIVFALAILTSSNVCLADMVTFGYAQSSQLKSEGKSKNGIYKNPMKGVNLLYLKEGKNNTGAMLTASYLTHKARSSQAPFKPQHSLYYSIGIGPSFKVNEYLTLAPYIGVAYISHTEETMSKAQKNIKGKKRTKSKSNFNGLDSQYGVIGGLNLLVSPFEKAVIKVGYEYAKFKNTDQGVFSVGLGIKF